MSSHGSHHRRTSTHPYHQDPQRSTSTLASSTGETKKTFLGRWKSVFRKEAMEMLPEQDSPISSFLQTSHITRPPALPPHPESNYPTAADLARYLVRLGLGTAGPAGSPATEQPASGRPRNTPILPVSNDPHYVYVSSTTELDLVWDNLNIPHAAYFPQREDPDYGTTAEPYPILSKDEPVRITTRSPTPPEPSNEPTTELPLQWGQRRLDIPRRRREPPRSVIEVAEELNQDDRDRRQAEHKRAEIFRRVDEGHRGQRIPGIDSRGETIYYTPTDSVASTEQPPSEEGVNGVLNGGSPSPSPIPSLPTLNTPPADHPDNHRAGPLPPVDR